jgi:haloalkane dehalogenase
MPPVDTAADILARHEAAGRYFEAAGVRSFVREQGKGDPVVCLHGVPASSFTYRRVIAEVAARSLRPVAFDFPGLGLADRPVNFDYTWTGLGHWAEAAVDALELERFHLLVHDIGGPIGFELAHKMPKRILSLTLLNTIVDVDTFERPFPMNLFARPGVGEAALRMTTRRSFRELMYRVAVHDRERLNAQEIDVYYDLLKRGDGGAAFLKIMRGFELTKRKRDKYRSVLRKVPYPVQILWGSKDKALPMQRYAHEARKAAGLKRFDRLPAGHFIQEERGSGVAKRIAAVAQTR